MTKELRNLVLGFLGSVCTVLISLNLIFIKKLVDKIEKIDNVQEVVWQIRQDGALSNLRIEDEVKHLKQEMIFLGRRVENLDKKRGG